MRRQVRSRILLSICMMILARVSLVGIASNIDGPGTEFISMPGLRCKNYSGGFTAQQNDAKHSMGGASRH
jgi:hypothetical protein